MRVSCPASVHPLPPSSICPHYGDELFSRSSLLEYTGRPDLHQRCACSSLDAIYMDVIAERMSQLLPLLHGTAHPCTATLPRISCHQEAETFVQQLSRYVFEFASAAVEGGLGIPTDTDSISTTSEQSSSCTWPSSINCWCWGGESSSCPWQPLVSSHVLEGIMKDSPMPPSLADAAEKVSSQPGTFKILTSLNADSDSRYILAARSNYRSSSAAHSCNFDTVKIPTRHFLQQ